MFNNTKNDYINIGYYIYTIFILYIGLTWYYNYAITDRNRLSKDSLSGISDLFSEHVIFPTFFMNNNFAHVFYSKRYLFGLDFNIFFPTILIIFSLLGIFVFIKNREKKLNYLFLISLLLSLILLIHMLFSFFHISGSIGM